MVHFCVLFCTYLSKATCPMMSAELTSHVSHRGCTVNIFFKNLTSFISFLNGSCLLLVQDKACGVDSPFWSLIFSKSSLFWWLLHCTSLPQVTVLIFSGQCCIFHFCFALVTLVSSVWFFSWFFLVYVRWGICLKIYKSDKLETQNKRRNFWNIHEQSQFGACRLFCCKKESRLQHFSFSNIASNSSLEFPFLFSWHGDQIHGRDFIQGFEWRDLFLQKASEDLWRLNWRL